MKTTTEAAEHYRRFAALPGSEQIASAFAIAGLAWWVRRRQPERMLELGAGIGTLTRVLLNGRQCASQRVDVVEPDAWCAEQLALNVPSMHLTVWPSSDGSFWATAWDLLVIDGCEDSDLGHLHLNRRAAVFVEGGRRRQRAALETMLAGTCRRWVAAQWKPVDRSKGFWVYQLEPTLAERWWFAAVRLREVLADAYAWMLGRPIGKRR